MIVNAFRIDYEGKKEIVFVEVNELGEIAYDGFGMAKAWMCIAEPNTEINYLVGQHLKPVESLKELKQFIRKKVK
jgi:hypothetical protein